MSITEASGAHLVECCIDQRNRKLDELSQLFVATHRATGLYSARILGFLMGESEWIRVARPTVDQVLDELRLADGRRSLWTDDIQKADLWNACSISRYRHYVPDLDFTAVTLVAAAPEPSQLA